jgi:hypothetical protein
MLSGKGPGVCCGVAVGVCFIGLKMASPALLAGWNRWCGPKRQNARIRRQWVLIAPSPRAGDPSFNGKVSAVIHCAVRERPFKDHSGKAKGSVFVGCECLFHFGLCLSAFAASCYGSIVLRLRGFENGSQGLPLGWAKLALPALIQSVMGAGALEQLSNGIG